MEQLARPAGLVAATGAWCRRDHRKEQSGRPATVPRTKRGCRDPAGTPALKRVEEVFERYAFVLNLHVGGQIIETTAEHPFYVLDKGWIPAYQLKKGDLLQTRDQRWLAVEGIADSGRMEKVYNFRIADYHTYFVGCDEWGFSVWAHNAECTVHLLADGRAEVRVGGTHVVTAPNRRIARKFAKSYAQRNGHTVDAAVHLEPATVRAFHDEVASGNYIVLDPHTTYKVGTHASYRTDAHGRLAEANFRIEAGNLTTSRQANPHRTAEIGELGRAQGLDDIGFHLGSDKAGFIDLYPNLVPGDANLNNTVFKSFERKLWKPADLHGTTADFRIRLGYDPTVDPTIASHLGNIRPTLFAVDATFSNGFSVVKVFPNSPVSAATRSAWYDVSNPLMKRVLGL